jgi:hypothetical protein
MKSKGTGKQDAVIKKPADNKHICINIDGCKVTMNFPAKPEGSALTDIKRMMVGGVVKT